MSSKFMTTIILLMALIGSSAIHAQNQRLVVWHKDGQKTYYDLEGNPKTTFLGTDIVITTSAMTISYPREQIMRYTYESITTTIEDIGDSPSIHIIQQKDGLVLEHLNPSTHVQIFAADGRLLQTHTIQKSSLTISLAHYPFGMYIIKIGDVTYKIMKL